MSTSQDDVIRIWDAVSFAGITPLGNKSGSVRSPVYSYDGSQLLVIASEHEIQQWDLMQKRYVQGFKNGQEIVSTVGWIPESKFIVSAQKEKVCFWDTQNGSLVETWQTAPVHDPHLSIDKDGKFVAFLRNQKTLRVYALQGLKNSERSLSGLQGALQTL